VISRRFLGAIISVGLVAPLLMGHPANVRGGTSDLIYPGCGPTVQACIDVATPGSTVFLAADAVGQNASIQKSVSLRSNSATKWKLNNVFVADLTDPVVSTVQGLNIVQKVFVYLNSSTGSAITLRNLDVDGQGAIAGIDLDIEATSTITVESNTVSLVGQASGIIVYGGGGVATIHLVGNRVDGHGNATSHVGIAVQVGPTGHRTVNLFNNAIWDVGRDGYPAIRVDSSQTVHADMNIVGNTVEQAGGDAFVQDSGLTSGGLLALDLFNNTFSHASARGIALDPGLAGTMTFRGGFNNTYANGLANRYLGLPKGSGNLAVNPKFVDRSGGDLALQSSSPLINKGKTCSPGGVANPDAAAHLRLSGKSVDIGAYERGSSSGMGIVVLGTDGPETQPGSLGDDILCGYGGADTLSPGPGNDYLDGGGGGDILVGSAGADRILGGGGNDTLCASDGTGTDFLNGGPGDDGFNADPGDVKKSVEHAAVCD